MLPSLAEIVMHNGALLSKSRQRVLRTDNSNVARRFAMHDLGLAHNKPYRKCARVVGEVGEEPCRKCSRVTAVPSRNPRVLHTYHPYGHPVVQDARCNKAP
eukprot:scaffold141108_cov19-Tisochrysis_lutea.AAC.1